MESLCFIGNLYCPNDSAEREAFFLRVEEFLASLNCSFVLGGDFNSTLNSGERRGMQDIIDPAFQNFVMGLNLADLPLSNTDFTWYSSRNGGIWCRLDRWLISKDSMVFFEGVSQAAEIWGFSDHRPVLLSLGTSDFGPKPFRFYNSWLLDKEFQELIAEWWNSTLVNGWAGFVLQQKLKSLRSSIRNWPGYYAAGSSTKIKNLEADLQIVMEDLESGNVTVDIRTKQLEILGGLWKEYKIEEANWRQKSRVKWFKEGEKFFFLPFYQSYKTS
ncbi:uncharacterized protein LOC130739495 [Lotus japonicus]|uniref:uncharacterized protein LOC130739495 n=1 Tax=Lotus japonicus TaxID=34305 RepID=UPI0025853DC3|nr:uncharacterized protein LOC130739495 [Lotus japonicus]